MLIKKLILFFIAVGLILPAFAFSQAEEIKEYKVQKGDTLWDISSKELKDPFLWPKIWKENPQIANPDKIYPNQAIKIPLYLLQKEAVREPMSEPVVEKVQKPVEEEVKLEPAPEKAASLVDKNVYIASGYIANFDAGLGKITGAADDRSLFGVNDLVYIKTNRPAYIGDKFYIIRKGEKVKQPATNFDWKNPSARRTGNVQKLGNVIEILGVAEVSKFEYGETIAKISVSFKDIVTGDILDTFYDLEPPVVSKPFRKPAITGYVLATKDLRLMNTRYDIVYIDKGEANGLQAGDILETIAVGTHKVPSGTIQIIRLRSNTATAIVISNPLGVMVGNQLRQAE